MERDGEERKYLIRNTLQAIIRVLQACINANDLKNTIKTHMLASKTPKQSLLTIIK